ncbi:MAG: DUF1761 family protein [Usitatibacter sp.]
MNRHFVISAIAVFVATSLLDFVVHGVILGPDYAQLTPNLFRTPEDSHHYIGLMLLANLLFAFGFTWIYRQGREDKPWVAQGARFGAAVAVMATIPTYLIYYVVQPMPGHVVAIQVVCAAISLPLVGILAAALNRDPATRAARSSA